MVLTIDKVVPISLQWYWSKPLGNEFLLFATPIWRQDVKRSDVKEKDLRDWISEQMDADLRKGFTYIKKADSNEVVIAFDCDKWMKANFLRQPAVLFQAPRTIEWSFKKRLPDVLMSHAPWAYLKRFIEDKFREFFRYNTRAIFQEKLRLLRKVNYTWFIYDADIQMGKIYVRIKPSVIMALLVGAKAVKSLLGSEPKVDPWSRE